MDAPGPCSAEAVRCSRLATLRRLDVQHRVAQGQVGVSLIKSMCSTEAPGCNAIKQVYRPPLPTFFFLTFHLYDKMPSPWSEHNSLPADSSRITTVRKRVRWEGMGGSNEAPQSHHGSRRLQSILSLTLLGRRTQQRACWSAVGGMRGKGRQDRIVWPGPREGMPPDPAAQAPRTLPLNRWRQEGLAWAEWYGWSVRGSLCLRSHLGSSRLGCFDKLLMSILLSRRKSSHLLYLSCFTTQSVHSLLLYDFHFVTAVNAGTCITAANYRTSSWLCQFHSNKVC